MTTVAVAACTPSKKPSHNRHRPAEAALPTPFVNARETPRQGQLRTPGKPHDEAARTPPPSHEMDTLMPEHKAVRSPPPSSVQAPPPVCQVKWRRTQGELRRNTNSGGQVHTPPPCNSPSPTNHLYPGCKRRRWTDTAAPTSTTTNDKDEPDSDTSYNDDHEHERRRGTWTACPQHRWRAWTWKHRYTLVRVVGGSGGSVRLQWVVAVPIPFCSLGDKFLYISV